eukprot:12477128-Alexandrium_andersonii.AAC.1
MVSQGWAVCCEGLAGLRDRFGVVGFPINRLALISKPGPDNTVKRRIVWDLRRSMVNGLVRQGERIVLPRISDVVADAVDLLRIHGPDLVSFLGTDVANAFRQAPLSPDEQKFTVVVLRGKYYFFRVLVFGAASAPTVWG